MIHAHPTCLIVCINTPPGTGEKSTGDAVDKAAALAVDLVARVGTPGGPSSLLEAIASDPWTFALCGGRGDDLEVFAADCSLNGRALRDRAYVMFRIVSVEDGGRHEHYLEVNGDVLLKPAESF